MKLTKVRLKQLIKEELDEMAGGAGDVQSMLDKHSEEKVYSTRARSRRGVSNSFMLILDQLLHKNKDGTYSIVFKLRSNQGVVLSDKLIEGEDFIFVDKVVKSYYVPSGR